MPVEEILVENGVVVGQGFCEPGEACGGDLFQRCLVGFVADATAIEHHPIFRVHRAENGERRRHHLQITRPTLEGHRLVGTNFLPIPFVSLIGKWFFYLFSMKTTDFHVHLITTFPLAPRRPSFSVRPAVFCFFKSFFLLAAQRADNRSRGDAPSLFDSFLSFLLVPSR